MSRTDVAVNRRTLLGACAGVAVAAALPTRPAAADGAQAPEAPVANPGALLPRNKIGIQLYTVRDQISTLGFAKVFERLARIGFKEVEFAGYTQGSVGAITVPQIRSLLDANGLRAVGSHVGNMTVDNVEQVLDDAETLGLTHVGIPSSSPADRTVAQWQAVADRFNQLGEAAKARGIKFYFHNHADEFAFTIDSPTTRIYDLLLAETDPALVYFELDILWAYVGQYRYGRAPLPTFDPIQIVTANRDRFPLFHVKDGKSNPASIDGYTMVDVGQGHIPFAEFFTALGEGPRHSYLNEHDNAAQQPHGSLGSAITSYAYMRYGLADWD